MLDFIKMQGTGNDFVLIDGRIQSERDWPELARAMCDRHFGVGADGILLVRESTIADYRMVMYNPDGSEAEMCGNGIRCFAKYLYDTGDERYTELSVETGAGVKHLTVEAGGERAQRIVVDMGVPIFDPPAIPIAVGGTEVIDLPLRVNERSLSLTAVSMGNPHAIHFLDQDVREFPLERIGPRVETDPLFPRRVNFEIAQAMSPQHINVRVWERGAGITLACGTGACAVFAAARRKGLIGETATISLPGGNLEMRLGPRGQVLMAGPAAFVFQGEWPDAR